MISKLTGGVIMCLCGVLIGSVGAVQAYHGIFEPLTVESKPTASKWLRAELKAVPSNDVPFNGEHFDIQPALGYRVLTPDMATAEHEVFSKDN